MPAPAYNFPDLLASEAEALRFYNLDLVDLSSLPLWAEKEDVKDALRHAAKGGFTPHLTTIDGHHVSGLDWLHERWTRILAEEKRRGHEKR